MLSFVAIVFEREFYYYLVYDHTNWSYSYALCVPTQQSSFWLRSGLSADKSAPSREKTTLT